MRRYSATAGVALVGASVIAITPVAPPPAPAHETRVASADVRLAAATGNILNIPLNLLIDMINIPDSEVQAFDMLARAQMFSGPWFVVGPTNIWGIDPGDPGRFMATVGLAVPFTALNGINYDPNDQRGLGQQVWMLAASELPVNGACAIGCMPTVPTSPITGIRVVDSLLWSAAILTGLVKFPLWNNFLKVPLSELISGYTFGPGTPGYANPGPAFPGLGFPGTTTVVDPDGQPQYLMPWANTTFTLDLSKPFDTYFDHLMADPSTNPIRLPDLVGLGRTLQTFAAGMVIAFDPITPGSALCPYGCANLPAQFDYPAVVKFIGDLWPGNENIDSWLTAYANGTANVPTQAQIDRNIELSWGPANGFWSFGNTPLPDSSANTGFNPSSLAPFFHKLWTALGLNPPPLAPGPDQEPDNVDAPTGGPVNELRASEKVVTADASALDDTELDNGEPERGPRRVGQPSDEGRVSTQAQQDVQAITPAATGAPADAAAMPNDADANASQSLAIDTTPDDNVAVPGKVGGNRANSHGGLRGALRSAADQIGSRNSKLTGGLTGDAKTGDTNTGDAKTGDTKTGESAPAASKRDDAGTGGRQRAGESGTGGTNSDNVSTGGGHRAE